MSEAVPADREEVAAPGGQRPVVLGLANSAGEVVAWTTLLAAVAVSRWAVSPPLLHDWDAANYALATQSFDVFEHQPHPPGYPLFVLALKVAGWAGGDVVNRFLLTNLVLGGAALVLLGRIVRPHAGPVGAWLLAVGFAVSPLFWYHGAASTAYVAESFCSVLVAATAWAVLERRIGWGLAGAALAIAIGIRPNAAVTLLPVAALAAALGRPRGPELARLIAVFGAVCLAWVTPLLIFGGGWSRYQEATAAISTWQLNYGSALGGDPSHVVKNGAGLATYLVDAVNLGLVLLVGNALIIVRHRLVPWRDVALLAAWFLPGAMFYAVHHLPKSGYVLTLSPAIFVAIAIASGRAWSIVAHGKGRRAWLVLQAVVMSAYLVINTGAFFLSVPRELLLYGDARIALPPVLLLTGDYGRRGLQYATWAHGRTGELLDELHPDRDAALFLFGAHELHRVQTWYHPSHWLIATSVDHGVAHSSRSGDLTFGELQLRLLHPPPRGYPTWSERTSIRRLGSKIELSRSGNTLGLVLEPFPEKLLVFYPCAPCDLDVGAGLRIREQPQVGGGYGATLLVPTEPPAVSSTPAP